MSSTLEPHTRGNAIRVTADIAQQNIRPDHLQRFGGASVMANINNSFADPDYVFTNAYGLRWDAPQETAYPATFVIDRGATVRFAQVSIGHDGRALATDVLKALEKLPR